MHIGDKIRQRIDEAIYLQDKLLLILSQSALESEWIETEVEVALDKEKRQDREMLFLCFSLCVLMTVLCRQHKHGPNTCVSSATLAILRTGRNHRSINEPLSG